MFKKFSHLDFKRYHPGGSLGKKLQTVEDLMLTKNKIPLSVTWQNKLIT